MKRIFVTLLICVLVVGGVYIYAINSDALSFSPVYLQSDFIVNELQIKNNRYYYDNLTDSQRQIYTAIAKSVKKLESKATVNNYTEDDTDFNDNAGIAMEAFLADHPEVFYINPRYEISNVTILFFHNRSLNLSYNISSETELKQKLESMKNEINNILAKVDSGASDFEKEVKIHDELGKKIKYDYSKELPEISHTAYGALVDNKAVCDGMAKAMQLLLDRVNVTSYFATGETDTGAHAWNIIKLDDEYYHLDLTSDKSIKNESGEDSSIVIHSYFNITDEKIKETHKISDKYKLPECKGTKYEYYNKTDSVLDNENAFSIDLRRIILAAKDVDAIEFRVNNIKNVEQKMAKVFSDMNWNNINRDITSKLYYYNILDTYVVLNKK